MSRDTAAIKLGAVAKGERVTMSVITACRSTGSITLRDDSTVYGTVKKEKPDQPQFLGSVTAIYGGGSNLRLEFDLTDPAYNLKLKPLVGYLSISDGAGTVKGSCYTIAVEDYADSDYNDYVISVLVTKKAR